jgi:hypothetical protein
MQAIDVAIWCALGHSRVAQRTTPIRAIVLVPVVMLIMKSFGRCCEVLKAAIRYGDLKQHHR